MSAELVGRDGEVARLRELVAAVAGGRGGSVWVEGGPGIGKSALLAAGLAGAGRSGCRVLSAAAGEVGGRFPLGGLVDCLRSGTGAEDAAVGEIAGLLRGEGGGTAAMPGDAVAVAVERLLEVVERWCGQSPVVLVADDLQWADELSLSVWGRLQALLGQLPLLLVGACRPVPVRGELVALRRRLVGEQPVVVRLGPLAPAHVVEVVGRLVGAALGPGLLRQAALAGGNPLYLRELVAALVRERRVRIEGGVAEVAEVAGTGGSRSLAAAVAGRLEFLSVPAVQVLRVAALFGEEFSVEDLTIVTGRPATELAPILDEAVAAGVVAAGAELRFRHGLIRQALYEAMPLSLRSALHRQAAQALAEAGVPVERVAAQLLAAPGTVDAWVVGWVADAAIALAHRVPELAVDLLTRVRGVVGADDARRERVDAGLATALLTLDRYDQVELVARPVLAATSDPQVAGQMTWILAHALHRMARHDQALKVLDAALQDVAIPPVWGARARALQSVVLVGCGRHAAAETAAVRAEAEGVRLGDWLAVGFALHALSLVRGRYRDDQMGALEAIDRALAAVGHGPETTELRLLLLGDRAACLARLGRPAEVESAIGGALLQAERAGRPPFLVSIRLQAADHWYGTGRWDDALAALAAVAEVPQAPAMRLWRHGLGALIASHRDDRLGLRKHVQAVRDLDLGAGSLQPFAKFLLAAQAVEAERDGQLERALALLLLVVDMIYPGRSREGDLGDRWIPDAVRLALTVGDIDLARDVTDAAVAVAERDQGPFAVAAAQHCRGLLAADPAVVLAVANHYNCLSFPLKRAQALENAAVLLAQRDQLPAARSAYAQALEAYGGLEAAWEIRRADSRLRPLRVQRGARGPRRRPATGWDALTPSEVTIAELVATGRSNPDIAAELFLSQRTVQTHVSHILAKLGGHSRVDIARAVLGRQLTTAG